MTAQDITDLRSTLKFLTSIPGQLVSIPTPVDPHCELVAVYKQAVGNCAALFERVTGFDMPVAAGVLATRQRTALFLGSSVDRLPFDLLEATERPCPAVMVHEAPCQEVIIRPPFDLRRLLPAPTHTPQDAGPYVTAGLVRAQDPETGESDVTIHRLCLHGADMLSIYFAPGRHIDRFRAQAERMGRALPVSVSIGLDPAVYLAACAPSPQGFDELALAGAIRRRPVELVECVSVRAQALARAEIVIEGEILPGVRVREDAPTLSGYAMPEFHGYMGVAQPEVPVIRATAITHRRNPIFQTIVGPAAERANLIGIPTEARILRETARALPGLLQNAYLHPAGGGTYLAILQVAEPSSAGDNQRREAALLTLDICRELKQVILVNEDVNIFDSDDVLWAMATRCRGEMDITFRPGPELRFLGEASRTVLDCTVPYHLRDRLRRPKFGVVKAGTVG
ncbi:MAG: UbiD family decarboxylase [Bryobacteraceae bacterium]|jgi:4-hydroxy-3-polyprenylbenzoate decarboxylase